MSEAGSNVYQCTVEVGGRVVAAFDCQPSQTLLEAATAAGWELPHSCRRGNCETCRVTVLEGVTRPAANNGTTLACQSHLLGPSRIAASRIERSQPSPRHRLTARLYRVRMAAQDVAIVELRFPVGKRVPFKAGQYLQVLLHDQSPRSFSMANGPKANDGVQLHIRVLPGGLFGDQYLRQMSPGDELEVELPFGDFYLRESDAPVVLIAGGTGFAPIQSLLEDALPRYPGRDFTLYWGSRNANGLYAIGQIERWTRRYKNFRFVGVLSEAEAEGIRRGLVHECVLNDYQDLSTHHVYVCGSPAMVSTVRSAFVSQRRLNLTNFFSDSFAHTAVTEADSG